MKHHRARWVKTELLSAKLGDRRLEKRLAIIVEAFANLPQASIPQASGLWSKTKATYRFLNNDKVTPEKILKPHQHATQKRAAQKKVVLAVQDTTSLNYTAHALATEGLGPIGTKHSEALGLIVHDTVAVTPDGLALGVVDAQVWVRDWEDKGSGRSIEQKESVKWLRSYQATAAVQPRL